MMSTPPSTVVAENTRNTKNTTNTTNTTDTTNNTDLPLHEDASDILNKGPAEQTLALYFQLFQGDRHTAGLQPHQIDKVVHPELTFSDPFQTIHGQTALCQLLNHFHHNVQHACFSIEGLSALQPFSDRHSGHCAAHYTGPYAGHGGTGSGKSTELTESSKPAKCEAHERVLTDRHWLVKWQFSGELKRIGHWQFPGVSEIELAPDGRVLRHTDYWDAGAHFYEQLPLLGRLIIWIRQKVAKDSQG